MALGLALRGLATSAIDVSDGLIADLGHIGERSSAALELRYADVPRSRAFAACSDERLAQECLLAGGDDYELCFTAKAAHHATIAQLGKRLKLPLSCIGTITREPGLIVRDADHQVLDIKGSGFDHFA